MNYQINRTKPIMFRRLTGIDVEKFDYLLPYFQESHDEYFRYHTLNGHPRKRIRPAVIYRSSPLPGIGERLYFILYYLKNNPTQTAMADRFDMDQGQCNRWIHVLYVVLRDALCEAGVTPASTDGDLRNLYGHMKETDLAVLLMTVPKERFQDPRTKVSRPTDTAERRNVIP